MADFFLQLAANKRARQVVNTLGLPVPMPQTLERTMTPWEERPLHDRTIVVGASQGAALSEVLAQTLTAAGADPWVLAEESWLGPWRTAGEAWGRPPHEVGEPADDEVAAGPLKPWALVFDATGVSSPDQLRALYDFFHPRIRGLAASGRLVVLGRFPDRAASVAQAAARRALEGFVRSCGREVGRKGSTANLVLVEEGAEDRVESVLRFLLSPRAAYVSGQPLWVTRFCRSTEPVKVRPLEGKTALITGAARGIGAAMARAMAREGAQVVVLDRPDDDALGSQVAHDIGGTFLGVDITDEDGPERIASFVQERFGGVDIVVHNAGITRDKTLAKMPPELWDLTLAVNLGAILKVTDALEPKLRDGGRVVCLSSIAGIAGNVGQTNYSASKAGVIGFIKAFAPKVASRGITVNAIAPGFIETRLTDAIPVATREVARRLSNLSQGGLPEDIAEVATFLASPGASGLSGQVLRVCGGNFVGA